MTLNVALRHLGQAICLTTKLSCFQLEAELTQRSAVPPTFGFRVCNKAGECPACDRIDPACMT
jgi:hypothetical protein